MSATAGRSVHRRRTGRLPARRDGDPSRRSSHDCERAATTVRAEARAGWHGRCSSEGSSRSTILVVGGNVAGKMLAHYDLGPCGNTVAGILGGGVGGQVLAVFVPALGTAAASGATDLASILAQIAGGGIGGSALLVVVGMAETRDGGECARQGSTAPRARASRRR